MTAFAFELTRDSVVIAGDTAFYAIGEGADIRPMGFRSKIRPVRHLRMVLLGRGPLVITEVLEGRLSGDPTITDADKAFARLPGLLRELTDEYASYNVADDGRHWSEKPIFQLVAFGWSPARGEMIGMTCQSQRLGTAYPGKFAPIPLQAGADSLPPIMPDVRRRITAGARDDQARLIAVMCELKRIHDDAGQPVIGGEIEIVKLDRDELSSRLAGRFAGAEAMDEDVANNRAMFDPDAARDAAQKLFNHRPEDSERLTRGTGLVSLDAIETNVVPIRPPADGLNRQQKRAAKAEARKAGKRR